MAAMFRRQRSPYLLLPAFLLTAGVFGAAMLLLFSYSAYTFRGGQLTEEVSFLAWQTFFGDPFYWGVVGNTLRLAFGVTLAALLVGYPTAYALTKVRGRRLVVACYLVIFSPLLVSLVVRVYGWLLILSENGVINQVLRALGLIQTPLKLIYNDVGVTIALVHILLPFMVFPILSVLLQFDHTLREAAADLGANRLRTFARVVMPMSLPGVVAGAQITFTLAISAFVTPELLGGGTVQVLSRAIWFNVVDVNWPLAAVEAIVLLALALITLAFFDLVARSLRAIRPTGVPRPRPAEPMGLIELVFRSGLIVVLAFILSPLVFVHAMLALPFAIALLAASLVNVNRTLEEAAMDLGAGPLRTFWSVTLPQIRAGLIIAAVFAFITSFDETEASIFLVRPSNLTLPVQMFLYLEQYQNPTLAALSTLLVGLTVVLVVGALRFVRGAEIARLVARR